MRALGQRSLLQSMVACAVRQGDCRELLTTVHEPVGLILTDPPYGISNASNAGGVSAAFSGYTSDKGGWDIEVPASEWVPLAVATLRPGGLFASFGTYGSLVPIYHALEACGMQFQSHITWHKTNPAPSIHRRMLTAANEIILVYSRGPRWYFDYEYAKKLAGGKQHHNHFDIPAVRKRFGVTRKPPRLCEHLVRLFCRPGDLVLDPFAGSGATLEAAIRAGRAAMGFELNREVYAALQEAA